MQVNSLSKQAVRWKSWFRQPAHQKKWITAENWKKHLKPSKKWSLHHIAS